jgi:Zn ribbon nucleic-acid-binding protein
VRLDDKGGGVTKIHDQRDVLGPLTVPHQEAHWAQFLFDRRFGRVPVKDARVLTAYVSDNRWVANCPECNGGIAAWDENPHGCCLDCGHVYVVKFPKDYKIAEALLLQRPPEHRHWMAHLGEPVANLAAENDEKMRSAS